MRLFNGFIEGFPDLVVELFGKTLVIFDHSREPHKNQNIVQGAVDFYRQALPWIQTGIIKLRFSPDQAQRRGERLFGENPDTRVQEHGVWYALDLRMNQDAGFYLDTRNVRRWAIEYLAGKRVLNTFAYTGSLGVAAYAAGATQVLQLDRNGRFLEMAAKSYLLNGISADPSDLLIGDFFSWVGRLKKRAALFDCIFLDPPFFSITEKGRVDQAKESHRLINKVRPLLAESGVLISINNALFTSGVDYLATLNNLCTDGYMQIELLLPVPEEVAGYPETIVSLPPVDPSPFNHPTKIAVLRVIKRKSQPEA